MLGQNKFFEKLELLVGEEIVWEGGASNKGVVCQFMHTIVSVIAVLVFFTVLFTFTNSFQPREGELSMVEQVESESDSKSDDSTEAEKPRVKTVYADKYFERVGVNLLSFLVFSVIATVLLAVLNIRSYWMVMTNERICIQSGILNKKLSFVDIDKMVSVVSTQPFFAKYFNLHHLEIIHSGIGGVSKNAWGNLYNPYKIIYVDVNNELSSKLLLNWLPRDNNE